MNREIEFRAKSGDKWLFGSLLIRDNPTNKSFIFHNEIPIEVNPDTIGQFTGLTDKYGKKIFEGDIFRFSNDGKLYVATFKYGMFYASVEECNKGIYGGYPLYHAFISAEIIGNIYDNPELKG